MCDIFCVGVVGMIFFGWVLVVVGGFDIFLGGYGWM